MSVESGKNITVLIEADAGDVIEDFVKKLLDHAKEEGVDVQGEFNRIVLTVNHDSPPTAEELLSVYWTESKRLWDEYENRSKRNISPEGLDQSMMGRLRRKMGL